MTTPSSYRPLLPRLFICGWIFFCSQAFPAILSTDHILITELSATNIDTIPDEEGDYPDWIELSNFSDERINLREYCLTDSKLTPRKYRLPSYNLPPGQRILIFASGKTHERLRPPFHAPFKLASGGEYLALVKQESGEVIQEFSPGFPKQTPGLSYGIPGPFPNSIEPRIAVEYAILSASTPGKPNSAINTAVRPLAPKASPARGFYQTPLRVVLSAKNKDTVIRFTIDGSEPSATNGRPYTEPISVSQTTVLRAISIEGKQASSVITHTYLFPGDIISQKRPEGFPEQWADTPADYAMDPRITEDSTYRSQLIPALRSLPSLSIVTDLKNLFSKDQGIYSNPRQHGKDWERPISMEWLQESDTHQINAGLRIQGGWFRDPKVTRKHSFRILFKRRYGEAKWRHRVFEEFGATDEFETLVLRAGGNDGYAWRDAHGTAQYIRDEFGRRTVLAMGQTAPRGRFIHLYLNACYWGLYNLCERPDENFSSSYHGGSPLDWDAINTGTAKNGSVDAWNHAAMRAGQVSGLPEYFAIQGKDERGIADPNLNQLFDMDHYIDYLLANIWIGNADWPDKNYWIGWLKTPPSGGFKFYPWDLEITMGNNRERSPLNYQAPHPDTLRSGATEPHFWFRSIPEYKTRFSDRIQKHTQPGGALSSEAVRERYRSLAQQVELAIITESARWGDDQTETPQLPEAWKKERDWILDTYALKRGSIVLDQLRKDGLYSRVHAPNFSIDSEDGRQLKLSSVSEYVFYTLDGSDPRQAGGATHPKAKQVNFDRSLPLQEDHTLISPKSIWRYASEMPAIRSNWASAAHSKETQWKLGFAPLGVGTKKVQTSMSRTIPKAQQANPPPFLLKKSFSLPVLLPIHELKMTIDCSDALAVYLNGNRIYRSPHLPSQTASTLYSGASRESNEMIEQILPGDGLLKQGKNDVVVVIHQRSASDSQTRFDLSITAQTIVNATKLHLASIPLQSVGTFKARARKEDRWSALVEEDFAVSVLQPAFGDLKISEISFNPKGPTSTKEKAVVEEATDFEYVAITNPGSTPYNLSRLRLTEGIEYQFPRNSFLPAQASIYVVKNSTAFQARFGESRTIAGEFKGRLNNAGELIRLETHERVVVDEVDYRTSSPWPVRKADKGSILRRLLKTKTAENQSASEWERALEESTPE